jgi:hypothetical protein
MIRLGGIIAGVLCLSACSQGAPRPIEAMLDYEAGTARSPDPVCIATHTLGMAFDEQRREIRQLLGEARSRPPRTPEEVQRWRSSMDWARHRTLEWQQIPSPSKGPPSVDPALAAELSEAAGRLAATDVGTTPREALGPLPASLRPEGAPGCRGVLTLSAAAELGDLAFVETISSCGPLCGSGTVYALRHGLRGWRPIAVAQTWIA